MISRRRQRGYLLITVVVTLFLLATVALLVTHNSAINASSASDELEAARAEYVARAGMQHALWRAGNNACMGDVSIPATTLGSDSYVAGISGAAAGTAYVLSADQDAWIRSDDVTRNNGTNSDQHIRFEAGIIEHSLTRFDLSSLPANAHINAATAWFHVRGGGEHPDGLISVHEITADWTETGATWETMDGKFDASSLATIPAQPDAAVWVSINLTAQVQAWINGQPNYGILMGSTAEGVHGRYSSREDGGNAPRLEVVVGGGAATPVTVAATGTLANGVARTLHDNTAAARQPPASSVLQPNGANGTDAWITAGQTSWNYGAHATLRVQPGNQRTLLHFDLKGAMPAGARVIAADLELYPTIVSTADTIELLSVTRAWAEGSCFGTCGPDDGATWDTYDGVNAWQAAGGDVKNEPAATASPTIAGEWVTWDITDLAHAWAADATTNFGVLLRGNSGSATFASSDEADPNLRPRLTLRYACECGSACSIPQGSGDILMVVDDANSPSPGDLEIQSYFEAWGYTVKRIADAANQNAFDADLAVHDVVFVSESVDAFALSTKLSTSPIGIVSASSDLNSELGMSTESAATVERALDVIDTDHYITRMFPPGVLRFKTVDTELEATSGVKSPDAQVLATAKGLDALVALETGGVSTKGGTVTTRRVLVPVGDSDVSWSYLTNNGQLIVQRSLAWAMNVDGGSAGNLLMVVVDPGSLTSQEAAKQALIESWGFTVAVIDEAASQAEFDASIAANDVAYVGEDIASGTLGTKLRDAPIGVVIEEEKITDEFGISSGETTFTGASIEITDNSHYISQPFNLGEVTFASSPQPVGGRAGTLAPALDVLAQRPSTSTSMLDVIETSGALYDSGTAAGRRVKLPWGGNDFDINSLTDDGKTIMQRSIEWGAGIGAAQSSSMIISTFSGATLGGLTFTDKDLVEYVADTDTASLYLEGAAVGLTQDVDAVHVLPSGHIVVSTIGSGSLGGQAYDNEDLVSYDPATDTGTLLFDGSALFTSGSTDISAVHVLSNGNLILTNEYPATLGGLAFEPNDIIEYDPALGTASMFLDGSGVGLSAWIDAVHLFDNGHIVLSTATAATLGGLSFNEGDLVQYDPGADSATLYFDGALFTDAEHIRSAYISGGNSPALGPIAHWKFDDGTGLTAVDSAGGHDGTLVNGPTWVAGQIGDALDFDGSNDLVSVPHQAIFTQVPMTVSAWFKLNTLPTTRSEHGTIIDKRHTADPWASWTLYVNETLGDKIRFQIRDSSETGYWLDSAASAVTNTWYHVAGTIDESYNAKLYVNGALEPDDDNIGSLFNSDDEIRIGAGWSGGNRLDGVVDDVRYYDRALSAAEISDLYTAGAGGGAGGGGSPYVERHTPWSASSSDTWQTMDLSVHGVPAGAVVEVAIINGNTSAQRWGGVRAVGSSLDRRFQLHEAEGNGVDAVTMHVQADGSGRIQHYSDNTGDVSFVLLGYWTGATYVERFDTFSAGGSGSWREHDFSAEGVGANQVAEIVIANTSTGSERFGGVRSSGSGTQRRFNIHEAESDGVDTVSLMVTTDASSIAEVYAGSNADIDFYVVGYWSTPPGAYIELGRAHSQMTSPAIWQSWDLASYGIPADAVVQVVMTNDGDTAEQEMGVRATASTQDRLLDLQEAESGGSDNGSMHAVVDSNRRIEAYSESGSTDRYFYPVGWWLPN